MINRNGGLFYGTLIDSGNLSAVLVDKDGSTMTGNVTISHTLSGGQNTFAYPNNYYDFTLRRTFARIGYGQTLPTINDYCLESEESNGVNINDIVYCGEAQCGYTKYNKVIYSYDYGGKASDGTMCYSYTFYNNTDNDITFYEIGQFVNVELSDPVHPFMTARCVNPNGWIIKSRENITLTIEMDFSCGEMIVNQGCRYFTSLFDTSIGQYGFKDYLGNEIQGTVTGVPSGPTGNTQAISDNSYATSSSYGIFARLGVGQTAVSPNDYCMENEMNEDEVNVNTLVECTSAVLLTNRNTNETGKWTYRYTFNNSSGSDVTIYEIGLFCKHTAGKFMIGRKVNENGWSFTAGQSKVIDVNIEICGATNEMETTPPNE